MHAQKVANLFVDEARLSGNRYAFVAHETKDINKIKDNDAHLIEVPIMKEGGEDPNDLLMTEIYYF